MRFTGGVGLEKRTKAVSFLELRSKKVENSFDHRFNSIISFYRNYLSTKYYVFRYILTRYASSVHFYERVVEAVKSSIRFEALPSFQNVLTF